MTPTRPAKQPAAPGGAEAPGDLDGGRGPARVPWGARVEPSMRVFPCLPRDACAGAGADRERTAEVAAP
jgi:hypothetical protein